MKINSSKNKNIEIPYKSKQSINPESTEEYQKVDFSKLVEENIVTEKINNFNKELDSTIRELENIAAKFSKEPFNQNLLKKYKFRLQRFLTQAMKMYQNVFETNTYQRTFLGKSKNKRITVIQTIDQEIQNLTMEILNKEKSRIKLLEKFNRLKGLILDLRIDN